ncbi:MAG: hypothetical protein KDC83_09285 [Flavobacteriales bacterium]|nr:hypothetical protein [Flavobacteriales bacterium]
MSRLKSICLFIAMSSWLLVISQSTLQDSIAVELENRKQSQLLQKQELELKSIEATEKFDKKRKILDTYSSQLGVAALLLVVAIGIYFYRRKNK